MVLTCSYRLALIFNRFNEFSLNWQNMYRFSFVFIPTHWFSSFLELLQLITKSFSLLLVDVQYCPQFFAVFNRFPLLVFDFLWTLAMSVIIFLFSTTSIVFLEYLSLSSYFLWLSSMLFDLLWFASLCERFKFGSARPPHPAKRKKDIPTCMPGSNRILRKLP